jgi:hypothetical protein
MAYSNAGLQLVSQAPGGGGRKIFSYSHATDPHTDVDASGYFSDGVTFGMAVGDIVLVEDVDTATLTVHRVASVSGTAATISAATLA